MKKIISVLLVILMILSLTSCGMEAKSGTIVTNENSRLQPIPGEDILVYDKYTNIVYYCFYVDDSYGVSYMSSYYNRNGKICRYIDGLIVEINE